MEGQSSVPPVAPAGGGPGAARTASVPVQRLVYDGRLGELYKIFIVNFLLGLVTLGIHRFWGKTRIRRYLWSHVSYDGDRLEYTGTGGELFKSFMIVAAILVAFSILLGIAQFAVTIFLGEDRFTEAMLQQGSTFIFYVVVFFLVLLGQYTALRYRLTRTRWRGIRGGLSGSAWRYAWKAVAYWLLQIVTLGQFVPFATVRLWRYRLNNVFFGTARAQFEGSGRQIYKPYLIAFLVGVVTMGAAYGAAWLIGGQELMQAGSMGKLDGAAEGESAEPGLPPHAEAVFRFIGLVFLFAIPAVLVTMIAQCWYWTRLLTLMARGTTIAGLRFAAAPKPGRLWWLLAGNFLLGLFTLGLGLPIVLHRLWRFVTEHLDITGAIDGTVIAQSQQVAPTRGEGLLEALDPSPF